MTWSPFKKRTIQRVSQSRAGIRSKPCELMPTLLDVHSIQMVLLEESVFQGKFTREGPF